MPKEQWSWTRVPWEWVVPFLVAVPWIATDGGSPNLGDTAYFVGVGRTLLSSHWASTFAQPGVQAGPLELAFYGAVGRLSALSGVGIGRLVAPVVELGVVALVVGVVGMLLAEEPLRRLVQGGVGTLTVVAGVPSLVVAGGHPADAVIPLLWLLAGHDARRGRVVRAALLIGLSANLEIWGILGAPTLLLGPRLRRAPGACVVLLAAALGPLVPFAVAGSVRMFDYHWLVSRASLVGLVLAPGSAFPWSLRLLQGGCAVAAGAVAARISRRGGFGVCSVPLAIVGVRLLLDPELGFFYYFAAWIVLALVAVGCASCSLWVRLGRAASRPSAAAAAVDA